MVAFEYCVVSVPQYSWRGSQRLGTHHLALPCREDLSNVSTTATPRWLDQGPRMFSGFDYTLPHQSIRLARRLIAKRSQKSMILLATRHREDRLTIPYAAHLFLIRRTNVQCNGRLPEAAPRRLRVCPRGWILYVAAT